MKKLISRDLSRMLRIDVIEKSIERHTNLLLSEIKLKISNEPFLIHASIVFWSQFELSSKEEHFLSNSPYTNIIHRRKLKETMKTPSSTSNSKILMAACKSKHLFQTKTRGNIEFILWNTSKRNQLKKSSVDMIKGIVAQINGHFFRESC